MASKRSSSADGIIELTEIIYKGTVPPRKADDNLDAQIGDLLNSGDKGAPKISAEVDADIDALLADMGGAGEPLGGVSSLSDINSLDDSDAADDFVDPNETLDLGMSDVDSLIGKLDIPSQKPSGAAVIDRGGADLDGVLDDLLGNSGGGGSFSGGGGSVGKQDLEAAGSGNFIDDIDALFDNIGGAPVAEEEQPEIPPAPSAPPKSADDFDLDAFIRGDAELAPPAPKKPNVAAVKEEKPVIAEKFDLDSLFDEKLDEDAPAAPAKPRAAAKNEPFDIGNLLSSEDVESPAKVPSAPKVSSVKSPSAPEAPSEPPVVDNDFPDFDAMLAEAPKPQPKSSASAAYAKASAPVSNDSFPEIDDLFAEIEQAQPKVAAAPVAAEAKAPAPDSSFSEIDDLFAEIEQAQPKVAAAPAAAEAKAPAPDGSFPELDDLLADFEPPQPKVAAAPAAAETKAPAPDSSFSEIDDLFAEIEQTQPKVAAAPAAVEAKAPAPDGSFPELDDLLADFEQPQPQVAAAPAAAETKAPDGSFPELDDLFAGIEQEQPKVAAASVAAEVKVPEPDNSFLGLEDLLADFEQPQPKVADAPVAAEVEAAPEPDNSFPELDDLLADFEQPQPKSADAPVAAEVEAPEPDNSFPGLDDLLADFEQPQPKGADAPVAAEVEAAPESDNSFPELDGLLADGEQVILEDSSLPPDAELPDEDAEFPDLDKLLAEASQIVEQAAEELAPAPRVEADDELDNLDALLADAPASLPTELDNLDALLADAPASLPTDTLADMPEEEAAGISALEPEEVVDIEEEAVDLGSGDLDAQAIEDLDALLALKPESSEKSAPATVNMDKLDDFQALLAEAPAEDAGFDAEGVDVASSSTTKLPSGDAGEMEELLSGVTLSIDDEGEFSPSESEIVHIDELGDLDALLGVTPGVDAPVAESAESEPTTELFTGQESSSPPTTATLLDNGVLNLDDPAPKLGFESALEPASAAAKLAEDEGLAKEQENASAKTTLMDELSMMEDVSSIKKNLLASVGEHLIPDEDEDHRLDQEAIEKASSWGDEDMSAYLRASMPAKDGFAPVGNDDLDRFISNKSDKNASKVLFESEEDQESGLPSKVQRSLSRQESNINELLIQSSIYGVALGKVEERIGKMEASLGGINLNGLLEEGSPFWNGLYDVVLKAAQAAHTPLAGPELAKHKERLADMEARLARVDGALENMASRMEKEYASRNDNISDSLSSFEEQLKGVEDRMGKIEAFLRDDLDKISAASAGRIIREEIAALLK